MTEQVRVCVSARTDFFEKYVTVPPVLQPELADFLEKHSASGRKTADLWSQARWNGNDRKLPWKIRICE